MELHPHFHIEDADFKTVQDVVYKHCGITLSDDKRSLVQARVARQVRLSGCKTAREYLESALSKRDGKDFREFIDAISTNLTSFFRESEHYKYLRDVELPRLLQHKRVAGDGRVLVWSAACSSGEEPYSLAMTILHAMKQMPATKAPWDLRILATDISTKMLAVAREGIYEDSRLATVPPAYRDQYLTPVGDGKHFSVSADLKRAVRFCHLNLMDAWPFKGPFDFIFCRNVMIYFDKETQQRLVERFWNVLDVHGLLFTGHSESLTHVAHRFDNRRPAIYHKPAA